jgi:hypothetical protein
MGGHGFCQRVDTMRGKKPSFAGRLRGRAALFQAARRLSAPSRPALEGFLFCVNEPLERPRVFQRNAAPPE